MNNRVDNHVKIRLLFSGFLDEHLVYFVQCFRVYSLCETGVLLRPVLENGLKVGTYLVRLLQDLLGLLVEVEFNTITDDHKVEN